jgi:hypothetical protein
MGLMLVRKEAFTTIKIKPAASKAVVNSVMEPVVMPVVECRINSKLPSGLVVFVK